MGKTSKPKKALVLDRETLVPLQPEQLEDVVGGFSVVITTSCCRYGSCTTKAAA